MVQKLEPNGRKSGDLGEEGSPETRKRKSLHPLLYQVCISQSIWPLDPFTLLKITDDLREFLLMCIISIDMYYSIN